MFKIGTVIVLYNEQQENVNARVVSPTEVFQIRDDLEIFMLRENDIAKETFEEVGLDQLEFKKKFIEKVASNSEMRDFLLRDKEELIIDSRKRETQNLDYGAFLENVLYKEDFIIKGDSIVITRSLISKRFKLNPFTVESEREFPLWVNFEFDREFKVNKGGVI